MTATILTEPYRLRERQRALGIATTSIEAVLPGESFPFVQAVDLDGHWSVMSGPQVAQAADCGVRFPPTFTVSSHDDAEKWVSLIAALYAKAVGR